MSITTFFYLSHDFNNYSRAKKEKKTLKINYNLFTNK